MAEGLCSRTGCRTLNGSSLQRCTECLAEVRMQARLGQLEYSGNNVHSRKQDESLPQSLAAVAHKRVQNSSRVSTAAQDSTLLLFLFLRAGNHVSSVHKPQHGGG